MDRVQLYLIFAGSGALIGALISPFVYWVKGRNLVKGFLVGAIVGALGNLILLIPLWLSLRQLVTTNSDKVDLAAIYNKGIAAALGGQRGEARSYFVQVTQADSQHIDAWLYLANLAATPLEAWSYIQQARAISPDHLGVQEAVRVVWPQVQHLYGESLY